MPWIEVYDTLPDHPKIVDLSLRLKIDRDAAVGKMVRLWTWALTNREAGLIRAVDTPLMPEIMRLPKTSYITLMGALHDAGLVDQMEDGSYMIHDWQEHVSMLLQKREEKRAQTRARVQRYRESTKSKKEEECNAENEDCNALHERYMSVSDALSNAATVPIPYLEGRKEATTDIGYQGDIYNNYNIARVCEESDFSTDCGKPVENFVENSDEDMKKAFRDFYRRDLRAWELPILRDVLRLYAPELVWKALGEASLHGAEKPLLYAREALLDWQSHGIEDLSDLQQWREDNGYE